MEALNANPRMVKVAKTKTIRYSKLDIIEYIKQIKNII